MVYKRYQQPEATSVLVLIILNIILFIASLFVTNLNNTLALAPSTWTHEPWTIITSMFMHAGIWHILANMLTLYFLGSSLCNMIGEKWFLVIYFVGGIISSFFCILFALYTPLVDPGIPVVGASGAIFAIAGVLTAIAPKAKVMIFPIPVPMPLWIAIIGGFILLTLLAQFTFKGMAIAWEGHLGGLLTGLIAGYILKKRRKYILL